MPDRTLVLCKPDAVERGLVGDHPHPLRAPAASASPPSSCARSTRSILARHYEEHVGKGFYADLVAFMSRGPVVTAAIEGPEDTWKVVRDDDGRDQPPQGRPGTIRGDLGIEFTENLVHGSDGPESAARELGHLLPRLGEHGSRRARPAAGRCPGRDHAL